MQELTNISTLSSPLEQSPFVLFSPALDTTVYERGIKTPPPEIDLSFGTFSLLLFREQRLMGFFFPSSCLFY